jgi:hypothetical protein
MVLYPIRQGLVERTASERHRLTRNEHAIPEPIAEDIIHGQ